MIATVTEAILGGVGGLVLGVGAMLVYSLAIGKGAKAKADALLD